MLVKKLPSTFFKMEIALPAFYDYESYTYCKEVRTVEKMYNRTGKSLQTLETEATVHAVTHRCMGGHACTRMHTTALMLSFPALLHEMISLVSSLYSVCS